LGELNFGVADVLNCAALPDLSPKERTIALHLQMYCLANDHQIFADGQVRPEWL
jgi:hypothetical protein